jgi:predicted phosphoribosyltransferase
MDRFMPKSASAATTALAEAVALERAKAGPVSLCRACGVAATQSGAVKCTVCGATDFEVISQEMIEKIAAVEGGLQEETTYDGRKLRWSEDARRGLWTMKNAYMRRRVKARVEKRARMMKLDAITLEFARQVIEEETGTPLEIQAVSKPHAQGAEPVENGAGAAGEARLIARDEKKNPLISTFDWTTDATQRIFRVPAGFMRSQTQERIEALARERGVSAIDLALVEDGIEIGKQMMAAMIATYSASSASPSTGAVAAPAAPPAAPAQSSGAARTVMVPAGNGSGYLNEVSPLTVRPSSEYPEG